MSNHTERKGIHIAGEFFESLDVIFREQPINDNGIDAHIEIKNPKNGTYNLIALQIKSGQSYLSSNSSLNHIFYFDKRLYDYWTSYNIPVVLLLVDETNRNIFWEHLSSDNIRRANNGYAIDVPKNKILNEKSLNELLAISDKPQYIKNLDYLRLSIPLIQAAMDYSVILESEEWVNKCSGRGDIALKIYDEDENLIQTLKWNAWFPLQLYQDVFVRLFPWADFEVDDDFYYDDDLVDYQNNHCSYDGEDDIYRDTYTTFAEYRETLPNIRYVLYSGEVGKYKLHLTVNELGKAILSVNQYLEEGKPYEGLYYDISIK